MKNPRHYIKKWYRFIDAHNASDYTRLIFFSVILGIFAGFSAVLFHETIHLITEFFEHIRHHGKQIAWTIVAIPAIGMVLQWIMAKVAPKEASERGVMEIIKAVSLRNGFISFKTTLFHFLAPAICIGTGGTVGPEAPAAQIGAGTVSAIGRILRLNDHQLKIFTAAGAGAAIAGVFNTPLAGVFFAIEVILINDFHASALSIFLLSSVSASAVSRVFLGNAPKFIFADVALGSHKVLPAYLILGLLCGLLSIIFIKSNDYIKSAFKKLYTKFPKLAGMTVIGLLMGGIALFVPEIMGIGYSTINNILTGNYSIEFISLLFVLKFILVILILAAGGFGGIFAPSLFMGACFGFIFAHTANLLFPISLDPTTFTLVGMGAMLAGINSIPITSIFILFEMTDNYHFILPLMLGTVGSHILTQMIMNGSIYQTALAKQGYHFSHGKMTNILKSVSVENVTQLGFTTIHEKTPISEVVRQFLQDPNDSIYTTNSKGEINGVISSQTLQHLITDFHDMKQLLVAKDVAEHKLVYIDANEDLEQASRLFSTKHLTELLVTIDHNKKHILGTLHYRDVLNVYNNHINQFNIKGGLASGFKALQVNNIHETIPGFSIAQITIPSSFVNKPLYKLDLRNKYKVDILVIERSSPFSTSESQTERLMPDKNFYFKRGDKIIVYGRTLDVVNFKTISEKSHQN